MSDKVRVETGAGVVEVKRSGIRGHVILAVLGTQCDQVEGGVLSMGVALRADEAGLVLAAIAELLPQGGPARDDERPSRAVLSSEPTASEVASVAAELHRAHQPLEQRVVEAFEAKHITVSEQTGELQAVTVEGVALLESMTPEERKVGITRYVVREGHRRNRVLAGVPPENSAVSSGTEPKSKECRCPVRPAYSPGSMASGSAHETALLNRWQAEHGAHRYARARDELAGALQCAEGRVGSGEAVLDMVADIFGQLRPASRM